MALTGSFTPKELQYQAETLYQGIAYTIFMALNPGGLTIDSTVAQWEAAKLAATNGYADQAGTVGVGSWNAGQSRWDLPPSIATFVASGGSFTFDTVLVKLTGRTYPVMLFTEPSPATLNSGQGRTYTFNLGQKQLTA